MKIENYNWRLSIKSQFNFMHSDFKSICHLSSVI